MTPRGGGRTPRWDIDDVLARTDLARLLDDVAQPATSAVRGRRWHCPMPDHDDHHASVTMHTDHRGHQRWRCWSGDDTHRGDALDLAVITQRLPRRQAIDWLARRAGLVAHEPLPPRPQRARRPPPAEVPLDPAVTRYVAGCERILWGPGGRDVLAWYHHRGFTDDLLRANHAGADPGRNRMHRPRGLPYGASPAAVLPALDPTGEVTYVQARYLEPGAGPKYDNPAGYLGSNPRLGWARAVGPIDARLLLICEGIPDAVTAAQAGYAAVGILGHQTPDKDVATRIGTHATKHGRSLVAVIDADDAGRLWGERLTDLLRDQGHALTTIEPPCAGLDLNVWALQDPTWSAALTTQLSASIEL